MRTSIVLVPVLAACLLSSLGGCAQREGASGDQALLKRFQQADASGDGKVSRDEFTDFLITESFESYDKNGKGYVTLEEFVAGGGTEATYRKIDRSGQGRVTLADAKASPIVRNQMVQPFDEADKVRSGYLTFEEFVAFREKFRAAVR
jgi:Ca2+-binding EF-hand superfamily protein